MKKNVILLWLKLFLFAALLLVPTVFAIATQFRQTVGFIADLGINQEVLATIQLNLDTLQGLKPHVTPDDVGQVDLAIDKSTRTLDAYAAMFDLKQPLLRELYVHTIAFGGLALLLGLVLAGILARNIVQIFRRLGEIAIERERQQATLRSLEDWQTVSKTVIHELRSSLTPIKLLAGQSAAPRGIEDAEGKDAVILTEVGKIESFIDELTNFARLPEPRKIDGDINETIDFAAQHFEFDRTSIAFARHAQKISILHDPGMIQRLLFNLVRNASEANSERDVTVSIRLERGKEHVRVHIVDDGKGIKAGQLSVIFGEGYSSKSKNLGIGLAICKKIALDHHGDLIATPSENGAHFILSLPLSDLNGGQRDQKASADR